MLQQIVSRRALILTAVLVVLSAAIVLQAQTVEKVMVPLGKAVGIQVSNPTKVQFVREDLLDLLSVSDEEVLLRAQPRVASGTTEVLIWDASGRRSVIVEVFDEMSIVRGKFAHIVGEPQVNFEVFPDTVYLRGAVTQDSKKALAEKVLASLLPDRKVVNMIEVRQAVGLEERIAAAINIPTVRVTLINPNSDPTNPQVRTAVASTTSNDRVILEGTCKDQLEYQRMVEVVQGFVTEEQISNLVTLTDPIQVAFQAYILEMRRSTSQELGIKWGGSTSVGGSMNQGVINFFENSANVFRGDTQAVGAPVPRTVNPLHMNNMNRFELIDARIHALEASGKAKVLANPKLLVYANAKPTKLAQAGWLGEGDQKTGKQPQMGQDPSTDSGLAFFDTGQQQEYEVGRDNTGQIIRRQLNGNLRLAIRDLFVNDDELKFSVFAKQAEIIPSANPAVNSRQVMTTIKIKNGETIVLGGLIQKKDTIDRNDVPGLSRLPLVGKLFRYQNKSSETTEMIVLLTPEIMGREKDPMLNKKFESVPVPRRDDRLEKLHDLFQDIRDRHVGESKDK